ncbi:23S rRNA (guanosine(2251)-2'-O)-methyltransferase RlmB [Agaribacterium haliotis]|uniref:23S rRNA (guanosine(2251)-2'-O)-methyltransferase RlmB n=1 Tax=Agaribacterium haliotis TaxID=2013869 RepID=UPI000BB581F6|nr:23S rRNA (guanosine(2251)-2'-O)-methyltransferase RlmB [Agaribacterium haliotis]
MSSETAFGFHALQVLLKTSPERIVKLYVAKGRQDQRMQKLLATCEQRAIKPLWLERDELDKLCDGRHQGVFAELKAGRSYAEKDLYQLLEKLDGPATLLVLDGVTDPHNLGACLRTADAAGVHAVIVPKDNSASLTDVARKVASGAADTVPLIAVTNLARCLKKLQELGCWVTGTAGEASENIYQADLGGSRVIVMGAEGKGMRRLTRECCDSLVKIPMAGEVSSLNVSVATGVILFELVRQRQLA